MNIVYRICAVLLVLGMPTAITVADEPAAAEKQPTAAEVLDRYIEALGGREAIEQLETRVCTGKLTTDLTDRQHPTYESLYLETRSAAPQSFLFQFWSDQGIRLEGFDGSMGWVKDRCGVQTDDHAWYRKEAFLLNPQGPLYIDRYFPGLTSLGRMELEGREVYALRPDSLKPQYYTLYFSTENNLLIAIGYHCWVEEYREVDGVLVPHRFVFGRKGGSSVYEFETVAHNVDLPDSLFALPSE